ncbi:MAG TPA: amidohydrolase family protein [Terriglobales bacterium]|nr:amidohydrolase family protein [Terriglobales bacterium]
MDGTANPAIDNAVIIVAGERIEAVGPAASVAIPDGAKVIDLSADTVMPGLINGHEHPTVRAYVGNEDPRHEGRNSLIQQLNMMDEPPAMQAARGVRDLRVELMCGVTTAYVVGELQYNDVYLKKAADAGVFPSPRLYLSGPWITTTGGYYPFPQTDGPWDLRRMVRRNIEAGAHHIKIVVNHGGMASGPANGRPFAGTNWTDEEMRAVVDEAHRLGVKVTAHAGDAIAEKQALEAGVDSIQHASVLTPEIINLFVQRKASIVSTAGAGQGFFQQSDFRYMDTEANSAADWIGYARKLVQGGRSLQGGRAAPDPQRQQARYAELRAARDRGVPIAVGNDNMVGLLHLDIYHLVDAGFTPSQAIYAATGGGAKALGIDRDVGTLEKGKFADIISIKGKPDQNILDLEKVNFIMVGGRDYTGLTFR